jgi:hypothetical protein
MDQTVAVGAIGQPSCCHFGVGFSPTDSISMAKLIDRKHSLALGRWRKRNRPPPQSVIRIRAEFNGVV